MGKVKRLRQKLHLAAKNDKKPTQIPKVTSSKLALKLPNTNLFADLNIDISKLKTKLNDETRSAKSTKLDKSSKSAIIHKRDKLKLRRELLMKKIDVVNQMKKELKVREKRKKTTLMGDTNPLHDALPSLESLLKNRPNVKQNITEPKKKKGIQKANRRKRELVEGVQVYKTILKNKEFQKNPLGAIGQHVEALVNYEKQKIGNNKGNKVK